MTKLYTALKSTMLFSLLSLYANAQITFAPIVTTGLVDPIDIAIPPNAVPANGSTRLFIAQQNGLIRLWNGSAFSDFMNVGTLISTGGERGLLSMAFHPAYNGTTNRYFFLFYTRTDGDLTVTRFETQSGNPNLGDFSTATLWINPIEHSARSNHNGGDLNFGADGFLYLSTGDGGGSGDPDENGQNTTSLLGKIIRMSVTATPPVTPEVVDIGLRNPFRWSFDKTTGDAWIGDVGQGTWEEISFKPAGSAGLNFGWDCFEGNASFEPAGCSGLTFTAPAFVYRNPDEGRSVVGGYVYRGTEYPALQGYYLAVDYYSGRIFRRSPAGVWAAQTTGTQGGISSFGEAPDGTLYAVSQFSYDLYKVTLTGVLPVVLSHFSGKRMSNVSELKWNTTSEQSTARFRIEYSRTATNFQTAGVLPASRSANGSNYTFQHTIATGEDLFYRLAMEDDDGSVSYSSIIKLPSAAKGGIKIYPTLIRNNALTIELDKPASKLQLINSSGAVVFEKNLQGLIGTNAVALPPVAKGVYVVQVVSGGKVVKEKVVIE